MPDPTFPAPSPEPSSTPFWVAAAACALPAAAGVYWSFSHSAEAADGPTRLAVLVLSGAAYLSAAWLFVWPSRARAYTRPMMELPEALAKVREQLNDLNLIKKEHNRAQTQMEGVATQIHAVLNTMHAETARRLAELDKRQAEFDRAVAERAQADTEASKERVLRDAATKLATKWEQAVLDFAQLLERTARPSAKVDAEYTAIASQFANDFRESFATFGLQVIAPAEGERFNDRAHQIEGEEERADVTAGAVARCVGWGYVVGSEVKKPARVVVAKAPRPQPPAVPPRPPVAPADSMPPPPPAFDATAPIQVDAPPTRTPARPPTGK